MSKTPALVWLTLLWVVYFLLTGILILPYGMGEPGGFCGHYVSGMLDGPSSSA